MSEQAVQESRVSAANNLDVDEIPTDSSSAEDEGSVDSKEYGEDDRVPLAAPDMKREITECQSKLKEQFSKVLLSLGKTEKMKFVVYVSDRNSKGAYGFRFKLESNRLGASQLTWESIRTVKELNKLADRLQNDNKIRGMGYSVPHLREKKSKGKVVVDSPASSERRLVLQFVRQMFTNFVFLGHTMVLNTFDVPGPVRTKIDTSARLNQTPLLSSYLNKQGWNVKSWKKRWVVLYPDFTLRYYESEKDGVGIGFRGMVDLQAMYQINHKQSDKGESQRFSLSMKSEWEQTQRARVYKFETPDLELRDNWIDAMWKLREGEISQYIPDFSISDGISSEELAAVSGVMRASFMKGRIRRPSQIQLEKEKESNIKLLTKLSEMREEQDNFEENQKKEQEEYERERKKVEDEWSDLKLKMAAAKKNLEREQESLKTIETELKQSEKRWEGKMENAEKEVKKERLRFHLRSAKFKVNPTVAAAKTYKRRRTVIENSAPSVYSDVLKMLTVGESETRKRDVWYLTIEAKPYMEWADLVDNMNPPVATRMEIAEVLPGKRLFQGRSFVVRSAKKDKNITFITSSHSECQKWIRIIKNGLGNDSDEEYMDESDMKMETDYKTEVIEEKQSLLDGKDSSLARVSKQVNELVMKKAAAKLKSHGIEGESEV